jgi:hypothetical protein
MLVGCLQRRPFSRNAGALLQEAFVSIAVAAHVPATTGNGTANPPQSRREGAMKLRLLLILIVLLLGGCRRGAYRQLAYDTLVAENRLLEDEKYQWKNDYEDAVDEIDRLRDEIEELRSGGSSVLVPGGSSRESDREPRDLFPRDVPDLDIDQGTPGGDQAPGRDSRTIEDDDELDDLEPPKLDLGGGDALSDTPLPIDRQVTDLHVHAQEITDRSSDQQAGGSGISITFEPRNRAGDFVPLPGPVTVELRDPQSRQQAAYWELDSQQIQAALQQSEAGGRGIELNLPWQTSPPSGSRMQLVVRYWPQQGDVVQSQSEITLTPHAQLTARWTPRTEQRPDPPAAHLRLADQSESVAGDAPAPSGNATNEPPPDRQARLPQWRPYR